MPRKINPPETPDRSNCEPEVEEEPYNIPEEAPVPIEVPVPVEVPVRS